MDDLMQMIEDMIHLIENDDILINTMEHILEHLQNAKDELELMID